MTAYNLTSSCTQPVIGWFADTRGFAVPIAISLLISGIFISLMGIAGDYRIIMLFAILAALGHASFHPVALSRVSRLCSAENRGRITSYFVIGGNIGYAIGPVIAAGLVYWLGLHGLLLLIIPAAVMAVTIRYILPGSAGSESIPAPVNKTHQRVSVSKNPFFILLVATILRSWVIYAAVTFLPTFLVENRGYSLFMASLIVTLMLLSGVVGQIFGGRLSDLYGRKEFMIVSMVATIPLFFTFFFTAGTLSLLALFLFGFALWSGMAVAVAMGHELLPHNIGLASGMMLGLAIGIGGIGAAVNGIIADHYSLPTALGILPVPLMVALLLIMILPYPWKLLRNQ